MNKIIVITGPTGVGKTKLSIALAKHYNGEIINADAMQVYKELNIGTAKITPQEQENIPHHLLDFKQVEEDYSIYEYQKDCRKAIKEILSKKKTPIIVGGTGLYIKSALYDYQLEKKKPNQEQYQFQSTEDLYQKLIQLDPKTIGKIDSKNRRRIINALSYYEQNQTSITNNKTNKLLYNTIFIGLTTNRETLYQKINNRVDEMIKNGLIEEVASFYQKKIYTKPLLSGIGYKELYAYFQNQITKEEAINLIKRNSRRYAKKQYTFFKHQLPITWIETDYHNFDNTIQNAIKIIDNKMLKNQKK